MAGLRFNQSNWSAGQLDPKCWSRDDIDLYYKSAKDLSNCVVIPQGGVQKRWGTNYIDTITSTDPANVQLSTLIYNDSAIYLLLWEATSLKIYLNNTLAATVVTSYMAEDIQNLRFTQTINDLVIANENFAPARLVRSASAAPNAITAITTANNTIQVSSPLTLGQILPVTFTTAGSLPTTSPQIFVNRTYYVKAITTTNLQIYSTAQEAEDGVAFYTVSALGVLSNVVTQNTWTIADIVFKFKPSYDFTGGYASLTFTPSAMTGNVTLTASGAIFTPEMVGGLFQGNGGAMRITGYTDTTHVTGYTTEDFLDTSAIQGAQSLLAEPAWSDVRGWPRTVTFFQNRLTFGGSTTLPNGVWLSAVNDGEDFDDSQSLDDDAISWYPASGSVSYVRALTSARTLLVHTNTGNFSTPVATENPVTPTNFTLTEQNKDGISAVQPIFIDNQIIYVDKSGNNIKNLIWDLIQSSYVLNNISVTSAVLINNPTDMDSFLEPNFTDGAYAFIINSDGTMAMFQTLKEQNIGAWSGANTQMSDGSAAYFRHLATGINDCWFLVERTVDGVAHLYIEQLDFVSYTDCSKSYTDWSSNVLTGLSFLEGETVQVIADGVVVQPQVVTGGQITLPDVVMEATVGLSFVANLTLIPLGAIYGTPANLYKPMHIRRLYVRYYQTIGATVMGTTIPTQVLGDVHLDQVPVPSDGVFSLGLMQGWDSINSDIQIQQTLPLPMTIIGVGYILEIPE